ncbi:MAG: NERD domain-containing protein/DEAD/DEAH box helicase [Chloroflexi bacterium]|nr:NERD domain-containing protein/DEAD/DEAH box helicase [Chloroflexota bacterium]
MATMIPETIPDRAPPSERKVFDLLQDDPDTHGWVVIHSSGHMPATGNPREIDFLAMAPGYGIICIEVKGGGFEVRAEEWRTLATGQAVEPPVRQAENAMYALRHELERRFGAGSPEAKTPTECVVVFTDTNWPDDVRRPTRQVIDHDDLASGMTLGRRLQAAALRMRAAAGRRAASDTPCTAQMVDHLRQYLAPDFTMDLVAAVGPTLDRIDEQLIRLTEEQYAALDLARDNDRCLFKGAAGTGKTLLAIECARRAAQADHRVALVCFNRLLANWLKECTQGTSGITAGTFWHDLMTPIIQAGSLWNEFQGIRSSVNERELFENVFPEYSRRALRDTGPLFDVLMVDEAQDLCQSPYLEIMDLALVGGLAEGRWAMFGDFTNQAIFLSGSADPERALLQYFAHPARRQLMINCRNSPPIARHTALIGRGEQPETINPNVHGPAPEYVYWDDADELCDELDEEIHRLLAEDVRIGEITVLSTNRLETSGLDTDRTYGSYPLFDHSRGSRLDVDDEDPAHLKFCSVQSFKGMESHVVVLVLERLDRGFDGPHAYIGMSRARGALTVLAHSALKPEIESRLG